MISWFHYRGLNSGHLDETTDYAVVEHSSESQSLVICEELDDLMNEQSVNFGQESNPENPMEVVVVLDYIAKL